MDLIIITCVPQVLEVSNGDNGKLTDKPRASISTDIRDRVQELLPRQTIPLLQKCVIDTLDVQRIVRAGYTNVTFSYDRGTGPIIFSPYIKTLSVFRLLLDVYRIEYYFEVESSSNMCLYSVVLLYCASCDVVFIVDEFTNDDEKQLEHILRELISNLQVYSDAAWRCMMEHYFSPLPVPPKLVPSSDCGDYVSKYEYI